MTTPRIEWRFGEVVAVMAETPAVKSLVLRVPGWPGHRAGQHVDVRLTAEDGYQAQWSYSIASAPEQGAPEQGAPELVTLTVERLADGEVSPFLTDEVRVGDRLEVTYQGQLAGRKSDWTFGLDVSVNKQTRFPFGPSVTVSTVNP